MAQFKQWYTTYSHLSQSKVSEYLVEHSRPCLLLTPEQPIGAKVYYTHFVLHDFPDEACLTILKHVVTVMEPGYSRLLLNEVVLPNERCPSLFATADITMMTNLAAQQRTQDEWIHLLRTAGYEVQGITMSGDEGDCEGVIEAVPGTHHRSE